MTMRSAILSTYAAPAAAMPAAAAAPKHQHMTGEQPRILFLHYWGIGPTRDLARDLRAALDRTATRVGAR